MGDIEDLDLGLLDPPYPGDLDLFLGDLDRNLGDMERLYGDLPLGDLALTSRLGERPPGDLDLIRPPGDLDLIRPLGDLDLIRPPGDLDLIRPPGDLDLIRPPGDLILSLDLLLDQDLLGDFDQLLLLVHDLDLERPLPTPLGPGLLDLLTGLNGDLLLYGDLDLYLLNLGLVERLRGPPLSKLRLSSSLRLLSSLQIYKYIFLNLQKVSCKCLHC